MADAPKRRVVMIGYDDAQILDITGPLEILASANDLPGHTGAYGVEIWARQAGLFSTTCGISLPATRSFCDVDEEDIKQIDTLMVSGGEGTIAAIADKDLISFIQRSAPLVRRVVSICSGAFLLAKAGLLDGKRATTHWAATDDLAKNFPDVDVDEDAIFVRAGKIWTSAGITAGMDLALALIEEDIDRDAALKVAQRHVMFMMRPGGQSQFSGTLLSQKLRKGRLAKLLVWMDENITTKLTVPALADQAAMSERTLLRVFNEETGESPAKFVERLRLEKARYALAETGDGIDRIAADCGFQSGEQMRRAFQRALGVSPSQYRERFQFRAPLAINQRSVIHDQNNRHPDL